MQTNNVTLTQIIHSIQLFEQIMAFSSFRFLGPANINYSHTKTIALFATAEPIFPIPIIPSVVPSSSIPNHLSGCHIFQSPFLAAAALIINCRFTASINPIARSAVAFVKTPGVNPTGIFSACTSFQVDIICTCSHITYNLQIWSKADDPFIYLVTQ